MTYKKKPIKAKLHKADTAVLASKVDKNKQALDRQKKIDQYNNIDIHQIDPFFNSIQLTGDYVIIRLFKENFIKGKMLIGETEVYDAWYDQVQISMYAQNKQKWVENPLPYVYGGVVVAMSPRVEAQQKKVQEELSLEGILCRYLMVGDTVDLEWFSLQDKRYFKNKQETDKIKDPEDFSVKHYEGYVRVHVSQIESIKL